MKPITSSTLVLKVGGSFFDDDSAQSNFFSTLSILQSMGKQVVVVHGGGNQVQAQLLALGFSSQKYQGLRVTPFEHMPIVAGVLAGTLNKQLTANARAVGINAVGLSLADGNLAICTQVSEKLGAVGEAVAQDSSLLDSLLANNMLPVISSIGSDKQGQLYNVNADHAAVCIAGLLDAELYLLSDVAGVLDAERNLIHELEPSLRVQLEQQQVITDGMLVKVNAAQEAADALGKPITIGSWQTISALVNSKSEQTGTLVFPNETIAHHLNSLDDE